MVLMGLLAGLAWGEITLGPLQTFERPNGPLYMRLATQESVARWVQSDAPLSDDAWTSAAAVAFTVTTATLEATPVATPEPEPLVKATVEEMRQEIKVRMIGFVKTHPTATAEEVIAGVGDTGIFQPAALLQLYIDQAHARGLIAEATFEALRALVLSLSVEELMRL